MPKPIASVYVGIARFAWEVGRVQKGELGGWTERLAECLATGDKSKHEYGAILLKEAEDYRHEESEKRLLRSKNKGLSAGIRRNPRQSAESALTDRQTDSNNLNNRTREQPPHTPPAGGDVQAKNPELQFEEARTLYPGTKNGHGTEWENFKRRAGKNFPSVAGVLLHAVNREIAYRKSLVSGGRFCPEWPHFRTWVNQRRWEQEFSQEAHNGNGRGHPHKSRSEKINADARELARKLAEAKGAG